MEHISVWCQPYPQGYSYLWTMAMEPSFIPSYVHLITRTRDYQTQSILPRSWACVSNEEDQ